MSDFSHMEMAAEKGDVKSLRLMIEAGADVNSKFGYLTRTALILAAGHGHQKCVKLLVKAGADVNYRDCYSDTALILAAQSGHDKCVDVLIESGADVNGSDTIRCTVLMIAAENGHDICVKLLIESGADVNTRFGFHERTALMLAATNGHEKCVDVLIKAGADVNIRDYDSQTALMLAATNGHVKCIETLIKSGADVNGSNYYDQTALMLAAKNGHDKCVETLIKAGADVNGSNHNGDTALSVGAENGHVKCVDTLVKSGADVNTQDANGDTCLSIASDVNVLKFLLKEGAHINVRNSHQENAILHHCFYLSADKKFASKFRKFSADKFLLLFAAGDSIETSTFSGNCYVRTGDKTVLPAMRRFIEENIEELNVDKKCAEMLRCIEQIESNQESLLAFSRATIRKRLLELDEHTNLFVRIPKLGLPSLLCNYLLYNQSVEEEEADKNRTVSL